VESLWTAIENAWNGILDLMSRLVMPDWGGLVALIPVALAGVAALFLIWVVRRWMSAGPRRSGPGRVEPRPPAGIHMPGPSLAPLLAAVGAFLAVFGLVLGGWAFWLGVGALVITLFYWLREGVRDYEQVEPEPERLPAVVHEGPPPGVHMPGPSFRPLLVACAATVLFFGLVFGGALLLAGVIVLAGALIGWLRDARREYVATVEADRTGHLDNGPEPSLPTGSIAVAGLIVAVAVAVNAGIIPPTSVAEGGQGGASPGASAGASPGASAAASAAPSLEIPAADLRVDAKGFAFTPNDLSATAGTAFTIAFVNGDPGVPHDMVIRDGSGAIVFQGEPVTGVAAVVYSVPALPAGTYPFVCSFHANMTGTLTTK
jgi:plastocyanin